MTKVATMTSCYRGEKYLKLFLEELPKQTAFDDIELVFNHNCPSPAEIEMINEYKSKYDNLNYTVEEELLPLYESWNKCIEESTSDYICVWNIDDLRTPNSIELMKNTLDENPDIDYVYGNFMVVPKFGSTTGYLARQDLHLHELETGMILGPFFMFRKSIVERCGFFDEQFKSGGDYDFAMRLVRNGQGVCLSDNLGYYLNEGAGLSTDGSELQPLERTVVERRYGINILEPRFMDRTMEYDIDNLSVGGSNIPVKEFI